MTSTRHQGSSGPETAFPSVQRISESTPRATKEHRCLVCSRPILPGRHHKKYVYLDLDAHGGPAFRSSRTHLYCEGGLE